MSTITGMSSRRRNSEAAVIPIQPGRIADEPTVPSPWSIGPGRPIPAPITVSRATPASASVSTTSSAAISRPFLGVVIGVQRAGALGQDRARQVRYRDPHVAVAEVDADGRAGARVEREQDRRAAALRAVRQAGLRPLDHQPVGLQVGDEAGDGGAAETGAAGDLGARDLALLAQRTDHAQAIEAAERFE